MLNLLALGIPLGLLLLGLSARFGLIWRVLVVSLSLTLFLVVVLLLVEPKTLSSHPWFDRSPLKECLLLLAMLAGMTARSLDQAIEERSQRIAKLRQKGTLRRKPKLRLDGWDFSRPFLVALPTFGGLLSQIDDRPLGWVLITLAFQTGFFWQTVLKKSEAQT